MSRYERIHIIKWNVGSEDDIAVRLHMDIIDCVKRDVYVCWVRLYACSVKLSTCTNALLRNTSALSGLYEVKKKIYGK